MTVGPMGEPGPAGAQGEPGPEGPPGLDGAPGPAGPPGADGADGADGPVGPRGPIGPQGLDGIVGPRGRAGGLVDATATVSAAAPGAAPSVVTTVNEGTIGLAFTLPSGSKGDKGDTGNTGSTGPAGSITGATATPLAAGATPTVGLGGTASARTFAFGIPAGAKGDKGDKGEQGPKGDPGAVDNVQWDALLGKPATFPPSTHSHNAADVASGTFALARIPTGTTGTTVALGNHTHAAATAAAAGLVPLATTTEAVAGTVTTKAVTPEGLAAFEAAKRPTRSRMVVIGSSNATVGTWPETLGSQLGLTVHNYAIGGGGFTSAVAGRFDTQVSNAVAGMTAQQRAEVGLFFIADTGNDVRALGAVYTPALGVISSIKTSFPNARIIVLPILWGQAGDNLIAGRMTSVTQRAEELRAACVNTGAEFIDYSWTWHWDDAGWMKPGEVHYTADGYTRVAMFVRKYLRGEPTDCPRGWALPWADSSAVDASTAYIYGRREQNNIVIHGTFTLVSAAAIDRNLFVFPTGLRPRDTTKITAVRNDRSVVTLDFYPNGHFRAFCAMALDSYHVSAIVPAF